MFPDEPRAAGGLTFEKAPRPRECAPAKDRPTRPDYVPLSRLRARPGDNPYALGEPATRVLDLTNRKRQQFRLYVSGGTLRTVRSYIAETSVCLETFRRSATAGKATLPVDLGARLVEAASRVTGADAAQLSAARDALAATGPATLAAVVAGAGGDLARVLDEAALAVAADLGAKVAAGELSAAEVAAFDVLARLTALANEDGAPFLFDPAELARTRADRGEELRRDPDAVLVGMRPLARPRSRTVVWYAFDGHRPGARAAGGPYKIKTSHGYVSECRYQAWTQIAVTAGTAKVRLWRVSPFLHVGGAGATSSSGLSPQLIHPASPASVRRYYDVQVKNRRVAASWYSIYGGWERGSGSQC